MTDEIKPSFLTDSYHDCAGYRIFGQFEEPGSVQQFIEQGYTEEQLTPQVRACIDALVIDESFWSRPPGTITPDNRFIMSMVPALRRARIRKNIEEQLSGTSQASEFSAA